MTDDSFSNTIQITDETREQLRKLAKLARRPMRQHLAVIIEQEFSRELSQPNPLITITEAEHASERVK